MSISSAFDIQTPVTPLGWRNITWGEERTFHINLCWKVCIAYLPPRTYLGFLYFILGIIALIIGIYISFIKITIKTMV